MCSGFNIPNDARMVGAVVTPTIPQSHEQQAYATILKALADVKQSRVNLAALITRSREQFDTINGQLRYFEDSCICGRNNTVAFNSFLSKNAANFGIQQPIYFDNITLNLGNGYDTRHGVFRAPRNGTYAFSTSVTTPASNQIAVEIVKNGEQLVQLRTLNDYMWSMATNVVNVYLTKGDDVWVRHSAIGDANALSVDDGLYTSFSGFLIHT
ncbi:hypothetical protein CHS0354_029861 [Potamilus streckersoni]|uniref:C1q domain-containing protein n=1 Tax=Potamilus streckersoni TaxID=2493646 RepID=A0AAE0TGI2_9BIVA|nr:hypothetical protein CHS0354_029861 [Potamilus streckersoni]